MIDKNLNLRCNACDEFIRHFASQKEADEYKKTVGEDALCEWCNDSYESSLAKDD